MSNDTNSVRRILGIMSGKGGVGKSTITVMLADMLVSMGYKVGILDADITCPSVPRLLNIQDEQLTSDSEHIYPYVTEKGLKIVSMNLMLDDANKPVVWRGSVMSTIIQQFWHKVKWEELDYLLIDMPPGTSDIALTVLQHIHPHGIIMVSIPQDLVQSIVTKTIEMVNQMNIRLIGVILNMSYYTCPCCGKDFVLYQNTNDDLSQFRILGRLPANVDIAGLTSSSGVLNEATEAIMKGIAKVVVEE